MSYGHPRVLGIPTPETLVIWASPVTLTLTQIAKLIWEGEPISLWFQEWGCLYHCNNANAKIKREETGEGKGGSPFHHRPFPADHALIFSQCLSLSRHPHYLRTWDRLVPAIWWRSGSELSSETQGQSVGSGEDNFRFSWLNWVFKNGSESNSGCRF